MANNARTVGVFFGSRSPEHDVSIITATLIISGLRKVGYNVLPIYLSKEGNWYISEEMTSVDLFKGNNVDERLSRLPMWNLNLALGRGKLVFERSKLFSKETRVVDIAFPAFHGPNGEDGTAQGLFELAQIPYVGCGVTASAITMDKALTKELYRGLEIPTTRFMYFTKPEWEEFRGDILKQATSLPFPLFVKPARAGSSIGITKVPGEKELEQAVEVAFHFDDKVVVEEGVVDVADLTVAVKGNWFDAPSIETSEIQESTFSDDFFTYEEKYINDGGAQTGNATKNLIIPAELDKKTTDLVKTMARHIYTSFGCTGTARVDFLYDKKTKKLYANEINTLPGTLYHHLWRDSGVSLAELLKDLLRFAEEARAHEREITYTFASDILKNLDGTKMSNKLQQ